MKLRILWPGKTRKEYYREAIKDYTARIGSLATLEIVETKEENFADRLRGPRIKKESAGLSGKRKSPVTVVLDAQGKEMNSEDFAAWMERNAQGGIDFILGGPEGCEIDNATLRLSFGRFTLPHELARVVLVEQIYRALTIQKRLPYHK